MDNDIIRIVFNGYFWTPIPLLILFAIAFFEGYIMSKILGVKIQTQWFYIKIIISNIIIYFIEYYLSLNINGGQVLMVWIPWVKVCSNSENINYFLSFPIIFLFTYIGETIINIVFLSKKYKAPKIIKASLISNLLSIALVIIIYNFLIFNFIKGNEIIHLIDGFPAKKQRGMLRPNFQQLFLDN